MYGVLVGVCDEKIPAGGLIGTHNVVHKASDYQVKSTEVSWEAPDTTKWKGAHI